MVLTETKNYYQMQCVYLRIRVEEATINLILSFARLHSFQANQTLLQNTFIKNVHTQEEVDIK